MKFFDIQKDARQLLKKRINRKINKFLLDGQYINGKENLQLEKKLSNFTKSRYCKLCSSGTDALLVALLSLDLKKNDEIITSAYSWISVAEVCKVLGLKIKFADIDLNNFNIELKNIEKVVSKRTKVIIPVSIFGMCSNLQEIKAFADKKKITLIEDAAQSLGSKSLNKNSCNIAHISCTSFFPTKVLGAYGDGGAIFTNNKKIHERIHKIVNHGSKNREKFELVGLNARMDTFQSLFLLEKIKNLNNSIKRRRLIAKMYLGFLKANNIFGYQTNDQNNHSVYAQFTLLVKNRVRFTKFLKKNKIPYKIYYKNPIYKNPAYKQNISLKNTEFVSRHSISLPINLHDLNITKLIIKKLNKIKNDKQIFYKKKPISMFR